MLRLGRRPHSLLSRHFNLGRKTRIFTTALITSSVPTIHLMLMMLLKTTLLLPKRDSSMTGKSSKVTKKDIQSEQTDQIDPKTQRIPS